MQSLVRCVVSTVVVLMALASSFAADDFFFKPNDRVLFLGDSITAQYQYSTDIELYLTTRFPKWNLTFINAGIGGDTAQGGKNRFKNHVLAEQPTAVTINFGMNDAGYGAFNPGRQKEYTDGTEAMLTMSKEAGVRVGLVSPNAVDRRIQERFKLYLETQREFYAPLKDLAAKHGASFVDQYAITRTALEKMEADNAKDVIPFGDGFHTASSGGLFMAHAILTGLKAPALVSHVGIDRNKFGTGTGAKTIGCSITAEQKTADGVSFERLDDALPLPVQKDWVSLLPYVNHLSDLNRYELSVAGLASGTYSIKIDDVEVATHSAEELAAGVNLGNVTKGPVYDQAQRVFSAINDKNNHVRDRFFGVVMFNAPSWLADVAAERKPKELAKRTEQINALQAEVYKVAQPVKRKFEVLKAN